MDKKNKEKTQSGSYFLNYIREVKMKEKKVYEEPIIEIIVLDNDDFIKMSNEADLEFPDGWLEP